MEGKNGEPEIQNKHQKEDTLNEETSKKHLDNLITWLDVFDLKVPDISIYSLRDGVILAEVLWQIDSSWFTEDWKSEIKRDVHETHHNMVENYKYIIKHMMNYIRHNGQVIPDTYVEPSSLDVVNGSSSELCRVFQLILLCIAIHKHSQVKYIDRVWAMKFEVSETLLYCLQQLRKDIPEKPAFLLPELDEYKDEGFVTLKDKSVKPFEEEQIDLFKPLSKEEEKWRQRYIQLQCEISNLRDEKILLSIKNKSLIEQLGKRREAKKKQFSLERSKLTSKINISSQNLINTQQNGDCYKKKMDELKLELHELYEPMIYQREQLLKIVDDYNKQTQQTETLNKDIDATGSEIHAGTEAELKVESRDCEDAVQSHEALQDIEDKAEGQQK